MTGTGRVTVLPLLHLWPDRYCVLAYTGTGAFGDTAVVGCAPVPGVPEVSLLDVAARHEPQRLYGSPAGRPEFAAACWLICTGWSGRGTPQPRSLDLRAAAWALDTERTIELGQTMYGHDRLCLGRFTLVDEALMGAAVKVLPDCAG
ncbi:hypothetical protein [Streptomyces sp. NPDC046887]|uniref:hypothetical protein n=1 Tax=Streptomyces sp. NPDC046887 TaxID=3155472 RepID=UPI00340F76F7